MNNGIRLVLFAAGPVAAFAAFVNAPFSGMAGIGWMIILGIGVITWLLGFGVGITLRRPAPV